MSRTYIADEIIEIDSILDKYQNTRNKKTKPKNYLWSSSSDDDEIKDKKSKNTPTPPKRPKRAVRQNKSYAINDSEDEENADPRDVPKIVNLTIESSDNEDLAAKLLKGIQRRTKKKRKSDAVEVDANIEIKVKFCGDKVERIKLCKSSPYGFRTILLQTLRKRDLEHEILKYKMLKQGVESTKILDLGDDRTISDLLYQKSLSEIHDTFIITLIDERQKTQAEPNLGLLKLNIMCENEKKNTQISILPDATVGQLKEKLMQLDAEYFVGFNEVQYTTVTKQHYQSRAANKKETKEALDKIGREGIIHRDHLNHLARDVEFRKTKETYTTEEIQRYKLVVFSPDGDEISDDEAVLNGDEPDLADDDQIEIRKRIVPNSQ